MTKLIYSAVVLLSCLFAPNAYSDVLASPLAGTYAGYAWVPGSDLKVPMTMTSVYYNEGGDQKAVFIVRLSLGGFVSHEYQAYSYTIDQFDHSKPTLDLDSNGNATTDDVSFFDGAVSADRTRITGKLQSNRSGLVDADYELTYVDENKTQEDTNAAINTIQPSLDIYPTLTGSYTSSCVGKEFLQIEAARTGSFNAAALTSFNSYEITGRFASRNVNAIYARVGSFTGKSPAEEAKRLRDHLPTTHALVLRPLSSTKGDFDFDMLRNLLVISAGDDTLCKITATGIDCGKCVYTRQTSAAAGDLLSKFVHKDYPTKFWRPSQHPTALALAPSITRDSAASDAKGTYLGYVSYGAANRTVALSIRTNLSGAPNANDTVGDRYVSLDMQIVSAQDMSNGTRPQVYPFRLNRAKLSDDIAQQIFASDADNFVQVSSWSKNKITGTLYSKSFGRLGEFVVIREGEPGADEFHELSKRRFIVGTFQNTSEWDKGVTMVSEVVIGLIHERTLPNAFFPYAFTGFVNHHIEGAMPTQFDVGMGKNDPIIRGVMDPYTNVGIIHLRSGRVIFGKFICDEAYIHIAAGISHAQTATHHVNRHFNMLKKK